MGLLDRLGLGASAEKRQRVAELEKRLKAHPSNVSTILALAEALVDLGTPKAAIKLLNDMGPVLQKNGQYLAAIAVFKKVTELDPAGREEGTAASRAALRRLEAASESKQLKVPAPRLGPGGLSHEDDGAQQKRETIQPVLQAIPLFKDVPPHLVDQLIEKIHLKTVDAGVTLFTEGAPGSSLLFIVSGEVEVSGQGEAGQDVPLRVLGPGDVAGEMSFLSSLPRSATLKTQTPTVILELERRAVDPLVGRSPKLREALQNLYRERVLNDVLVRSTLFGNLSAEVRAEIARLLVPASVEAGQRVPSDDPNQEGLFLIAQGLVRIAAKEDGREVERAMLSPPAFFGNLSAGRGSAEAVVATAVTDVELFCLSPEDLAPILTAHPRIWSAVEEIQVGRLGARSAADRSAV